MRKSRVRWIVLGMATAIVAAGILLAIWDLQSHRRGGEAMSTSSSNEDNLSLQESATLEADESDASTPGTGGPGDKARVQDSVDFIIWDSTGKVKDRQSSR